MGGEKRGGRQKGGREAEETERRGTVLFSCCSHIKKKQVDKKKTFLLQ